MPIQPKPSADTSRPDLPNVRFCISSSLVNRTITLTAPSGHRVQRGLHFFTAPHIAPDREGAAALLLDQACRLLIALVGYVGDDDARTLPGERQRRRPTDAARAAGDECDLTFEEISIVFHLLYSLVLWAQRRFDRPALIHGASTHCHIV